MKFIFICKESFKPCQGSKFTQKRCKVGFMQLSFLDISTNSTGTSTWSAYMRPWSLLTCESILRRDPSNQTQRLWYLAPPCEQGVLMFKKKLTQTWDLTTYVPGPRSEAPDFETKIPRHLVLTTSGYLPTARFLVPCPRYLLPAAEGFAGRDLAGRLVSVEHQVGAEHPQIQLDQDQGSGSVLSGSTVIKIRISIRTISAFLKKGTCLHMLLMAKFMLSLYQSI